MTPSRRPVPARTLRATLVPVCLAPVCLALVSLVPIPGLAAGPARAAPTAHPFDGAWSVVATAETGNCTGPYRYPIVIRAGLVDDAGGSGVEASGRADAAGRISGTIRSGLASVAVTGRLRGAAGSGRWSLTGISPFTGRWTARRTS